jgi:ABC-type lipoprotein release transport system permease subunit
VPWSRLALCAVAAGVLGLLASLVPARGAAWLSPVVALATE